jgi:F-type H+-transporting ATPase subunit gamma
MTYLLILLMDFRLISLLSMTETTKDIKNKISSVDNIQQITRAMQLMSVAKMRKARDRATNSRPYARRAREILETVTKTQTIQHPLLQYQDTERSLAVVIASDKGLCGNFNTAVKRQLNTLKTSTPRELSVVAVGEKTAQFSKRNDYEISATFSGFDEKTEIADIGGLFSAVHNLFLSASYHRVVVVYTHYESATQHIPLVRQLFPVDAENMGETLTAEDDKNTTDRSVMRNYIFEPSESAVAGAVLPRFSRARLYQAAMESQASEHSARMLAMKSATENAEEMSEELETEYNRARQSEITQEIADISSAANALQ